MPTIDDYLELDLTGLNVDHVTPMRAILMADFGNGYRDTIRVGPRGGTRQFTLSAGVWPDDAADRRDELDGVLHDVLRRATRQC